MPLLFIRYSDVAARRRLNPREFERRNNGAMEESLGYLKGEVQKAMPVDNDVARGSISTEILRGRGAEIRGVVGPIGPGAAEATRYIAVLERGRRPNKKGPPVEIIEKWMERKGIEGGRKRAWMIVRAIGRRGFKDRPEGWQMFKKARDNGRPVVRAIFRSWFRDI